MQTDNKGVTMRKCRDCKVTKEVSEYYLTTSKGKKFPRPECKECSRIASAKNHSKKADSDPDYLKAHSAKGKTWRERNPEKAARTLRMNSWKQHGIDPVKAEEYYQAHNGLCDLCHEPNNSARAMAVDHCHKTGKIRGMLHSNCNTMLGMAKDSPRILILAIDYLNRSLD
jgi:hypothetical protein